MDEVVVAPELAEPVLLPVSVVVHSPFVQVVVRVEPEVVDDVALPVLVELDVDDVDVVVRVVQSTNT
ncbi:MAG: hypothetical protein HC858_05895 [Brachymonas sp.]|nr:hypothetical protein [Brachymonas sp.]